MSTNEPDWVELKVIGEIKEVSRLHRYYRFYFETENVNINIPFKKMKSQKALNVGDIIEIKIEKNKKNYRFKWFNRYLTNIYLQELKSLNGTKIQILGEIYFRTKTGYFVDFHGYNCFLSNKHSVYNNNLSSRLEIQKLFFKKIPFVVIRVEGTSVFLSRKNIDKMIQQEKKMKLINQFKVGFRFKGVVYKILSYGVIVKNNNLTGLLHISNFDKKGLRKKDLKTIKFFRSNFKVGNEINALVSQVGENKIFLSLNNNDTKILSKKYETFISITS